ncbi:MULTISPECIES: N-acetyltransferase [Sphingobacterium]|uniref:N-acetyltransferase n=1 Tax=Sphingobacterium TaxID=28453 RepID=UPI00257DDEB8|nr:MULTISPECIES: N-acetyltransferase [Sphingobacterium]
MVNNTLNFQFVTALSEEESMAIMDLWNQEYPASLSYANLAEFEDYISSLLAPVHILVRKDNHLIGWAVKFYRDNQRWFAIILSNIIQGRGLGLDLMNKLKKDEQELNGWVIDNDLGIKQDKKPYRSPLGFYTKNNFALLTDQRLELPTLSAVKVIWTNKISYES